MQHFNGLLKPSSGKVSVEGVDLASPGISWPDLRRRVGLVLQYPEHQLFEETVFDDISFVLQRQKIFSPGEILDKVHAACRSVGLDEEFLHRSPFELSRGEMRRVALAGVLAQEPHLIILDEPTVGLDGPGRREILKEIREMRLSGKTVVIISHLVEDLIGLTDRLVVLEKGTVLTSGTPGEVFSFLLRRGQGDFLVPSLARLMEELRNGGWNFSGTPYQVEDVLQAIEVVLKTRSSTSGEQN